MDRHSNHWLHGKVLYQIYPRSFKDSSGDGVGDLKGITEQLDYLAGTPDSLGVDILWLSPFYPSPMADFGYDVSDFTDVHPLFGTLDDFKELLAGAHARGMKVLVDFVPNHTSDEHSWFIESRSSRDNPKRDWYVWRDPKPDGSPPNNWLSVFGGSAWEFDEPTGQYYLHSFLAKQPDLDWNNTEVRTAMRQQMQFWLDLGVDGFRVDAVAWISKDPDYRDEPPNPAYREGVDDPRNALLHEYSEEGPMLYEYLQAMSSVVAAQPGRFMITEAYPDLWDDVGAYRDFYRNVNPWASAPFNFGGIQSPWTAGSFRGFIDEFQAMLEPDYLPIYCFGNHDKPRLASRIGPEAARAAAVLLMTLPGVATLYYGDELGMTDVPLRPDQIRDPFEKNVPGKGLGRDPGRTPFPWDTTRHAGFTAGRPWLPIGQNALHSLAVQQADEQSYFHLYKRLIDLRKSTPALKTGSYRSIETPPHVFGFVREQDGERLYVYINYTDRSIHVPLETAMDVLLTTERQKPHFIARTLVLRPHEGVLLLPL